MSKASEHAELVKAIRVSFNKNDRAVMRAIVALFMFQTESERAIQATTESNNQGFTSSDARWMTFYAKIILKVDRNETSQQTHKKVVDYLVYGHDPAKHREIFGSYMMNARKRIHKYAGQIARVSPMLQQMKQLVKESVAA